MEDEEKVKVDFNVEHGKGDRLFHQSDRLEMIMEEALKAYTLNMSRMMSQAVENTDERQKLQQTAERERIEYQEKLKKGD